MSEPFKMPCTICAGSDHDMSVCAGANLYICNLCIEDLSQLLREHRPIQDKDRERYSWVATLADGTELREKDGHKMTELPETVVLLRLEPNRNDLAPVRMILRPDNGEKGVKFLQVTQSSLNGRLGQIRDILRLDQPGARSVYVIIDADGALTVTTDPNC